MGSIREALSNFFNRKAVDIFRFTNSEYVGGKYAVMADDPESYMKKGLLYNPDLASVINYISKVAVRIPWLLKDGENVIDNHPIYEIWDKGNPISRGGHIRSNAIQQFLVTGNAFLYGIAPESGVNAGKFKELWNLPYNLDIEKGPAEQPILYYVNKLTREKIEADLVLHWKTANPEGDGYFGTSPLKAARLVLQQSNDSYEANAKSLQNMGVRGLLMREGMDQAGPEAAKKLSEELQRQLGGSKNFGKIPIAGGKYDYINFAVSPVDLALLDSQMKSRQAICNIYNFPSELMNDKEASTYNNMQTVLRRFYTDVEIPLLEDFADVLNEWWVKQWGDNLEFRPDWSGIESLQRDKAELVKWLDQAWWIPAERKSEILGEEQTIKGHFIPMNLISDTDIEIPTDDAIEAYVVEAQ